MHRMIGPNMICSKTKGAVVLALLLVCAVIGTGCHKHAALITPPAISPATAIPPPNVAVSNAPVAAPVASSPPLSPPPGRPAPTPAPQDPRVAELNQVEQDIKAQQVQVAIAEAQASSAQSKVETAQATGAGYEEVARLEGVAGDKLGEQKAALEKLLPLIESRDRLRVQLGLPAI